MLVQKPYTTEEIEGLQKCFVYYCEDAEKSRWKGIEKVEANTPERQNIFAVLKQEYTEKYLSLSKPLIKDEAHNAADLEYGVKNTG